jgi:hypothetical protein
MNVGMREERSGGTIERLREGETEGRSKTPIIGVRGHLHEHGDNPVVFLIQRGCFIAIDIPASNGELQPGLGFGGLGFGVG